MQPVFSDFVHICSDRGTEWVSNSQVSSADGVNNKIIRYSGTRLPSFEHGKRCAHHGVARS